MKSRVAAGIRSFFTTFLFLAPWFLAFSTYRVFLLQRFTEEPFEFGTGLLNALLLSKVIVTGDHLKLGKGQENKPLIYPTIWKAFLFTLLATAFYVIEHFLRGLLRGGGIARALEAVGEIGAWQLLVRSLVMYFAFLPFFALRETGRTMGEGKLEALFFRSRASTDPQGQTAH